MCKESYERGLGKVYGYAIDGSGESGGQRVDVVFRPGKTERDRLSGQHSRNLANRQERGSRPSSGSATGKKRG